MTSAYIFDRVYERGSALTTIYVIFIIIHMIYANISNGGQFNATIYRMRGGGAMFVFTNKLLIYKTAGE